MRNLRSIHLVFAAVGALTFLVSPKAQASTRPIFTGSDRGAALMVADGPSGHDDTNQFFDLMSVAATSQPLGVTQKDLTSPDGVVEMQCRLGKLMPLASCAVIVNKGEGATIDAGKRIFEYHSNASEIMTWAKHSFQLDADEGFEFRSVDRALTVKLSEDGFAISFKSQL